MKAENPVFIRPVKVKTTGIFGEMEIEQMLMDQALRGTKQNWEEIPEKDTPELDTETIFETKAPNGEILKLHQVTVPFPIDKYEILEKMTATRAMELCSQICERENWKGYLHTMAALTQLSMEI